MSFKIGDIVVDEDWIEGEREGVVESAYDSWCLVRWNVNVEEEYFSSTNIEWLKLKYAHGSIG